MLDSFYDVIIVGGGVVGTAVARELSRYVLSICLLEKEEDVCSGTSKANSAIVHAGFDAFPGTLKANFNVKGNAMMEALWVRAVPPINAVTVEVAPVATQRNVLCTQRLQKHQI